MNCRESSAREVAAQPAKTWVGSSMWSSTGAAGRAAVIDFGGFLGVGSRKIAVDWDALSFPRPGDKAGRVTLEFTRDQVKAGPEYQDGRSVVVLGAQGKLEPFPFQ